MRLLVCIALGAVPCTAFASPPSGTWQVVGASVSTEREDRLLYQRNDARLVGRFITFLPDQITSDLQEAFGCKQLRWVVTHTSLDALLIQTLQRTKPASSGAAGQAGQQARAFGLLLSAPADQPTDVQWLACSQGSLGPLNEAASAPKGSQTWLVSAPQGQRHMLWYGDTVLTLKAVPAGSRTRPSFACNRARLAAERSICASNSLASLDKSLATAWADALKACEGQPACLQPLRQQQKAWVKQRNQCVRDEACLLQALRDRLESLITFSPD